MNELLLKKAKTQLGKDAILSEVLQTTSVLKIPKSGNVYNELVKAIVYQQISYKAADSIFARFVSLIGSEEYVPHELLQIKHEELRGVGFSNQKAQYVLNISDFFQEHDLVQQNWDALSDQEILDLLTQIKGVGEWTVQMILIFNLQRNDVFPYKDLAIQLVMKELYGINKEKKALFVEMLKIADNWSPFRTIASLYLWSWRRDRLNERKDNRKI